MRVSAGGSEPDGEMRFSLFYFSSDGLSGSENKYRLLIESAKFADEHGFTAIWTPERHFPAVRGLYPNPSVLNAWLPAIQIHRLPSKSCCGRPLAFRNAAQPTTIPRCWVRMNRAVGAEGWKRGQIAPNPSSASIWQPLHRYRAKSALTCPAYLRHSRRNAREPRPKNLCSLKTGSGNRPERPRLRSPNLMSILLQGRLPARHA
nr:luciferase family protein [uncultured bacterium]